MMLFSAFLMDVEVSTVVRGKKNRRENTDHDKRYREVRAERQVERLRG